MEKLSIYGGQGFIGGRFSKLYPEKSHVMGRNYISSPNKDALYFISTTHNYNVFSDVYLDIDTNLTKLMDVLPNIKGTFNFISSWFCYGDGHEKVELAATEKSECNPKGFYSITKNCAEKLLVSYCETMGKSYRIIRLCNVIGNDPKAGPKKNALEFFIKKILNDEEISLYDGDNYRNYLHVDDVCAAIKLIEETGELNQIYNVGGTNSHRFIDIIQYVIDKTNSKSKIKLVQTPSFHKTVQTKDFFMNCNKVRGLGFVQKYSLHEALDKVIAGVK